MTKGIIFSLISSILFGLLYYYPALLQPMNSEVIFYWRILLSLPAIAILITLNRSWHLVSELIVRIKQKPTLIFGLLATAILLGIEMLLFVWAPINGHAVTTSLGYFILPLALAFTGRVVYKDHLSKLQILAIAVALIGVIAEIYYTGTFSWDTAVVFIGYPLYFVIRKRMRTDNIGGFFIDIFLIAIVCLLLLLHGEKTPFAIYQQYPSFIVLVPLLGVITATAFGTYFGAVRRLPMVLFGLLGYVEPIIFVLISLFLLNEVIPPDQVLSYVCIFIAVFMLVADGVLHSIMYFIRKRRQNAKKSNKN